MEIKHCDGSVTETVQLPDVDSELMEVANVFYKLCTKYNRQVLICIEILSKENMCFFHIAPLSTDLASEEFRNYQYKYFSRVHGAMLKNSYGNIGVVNLRDVKEEELKKYLPPDPPNGK